MRETDGQRSSWFWETLREPLHLVAGTAAVAIVALTVIKMVTYQPDGPDGTQFVGISQEAASMQPELPSARDRQNATSDHAGDVSDGTVVRNGVTVLSPEMRIPVIDRAELEESPDSEDKPARKAPSTRRHARHVKRFSSRSQKNLLTAKRWKAQLALR